MSRFYGRVRGQAKTEATRRGSPTSGLVTECNGWDVGVECRATVDLNGEDRIEVWMTAGSNSDGSCYIGSVSRVNGLVTFIAHSNGVVQWGTPRGIE
jgi:hypothetical protein